MRNSEQVREILGDVHEGDCATTMGPPGPFPCDCDISKMIDSILEHPMSGEHRFSRGLSTASPAPVNVTQPYRAPEPKDPSNAHFRISMFKSALRFMGYIFLPFSIIGGALVLIAAEALGILEEL